MSDFCTHIRWRVRIEFIQSISSFTVFTVYRVHAKLRKVQSHVGFTTTNLVVFSIPRTLFYNRVNRCSLFYPTVLFSRTCSLYCRELVQLPGKSIRIMAASAAVAASIVMLILLVHSGVGLHDKETIWYGAAPLANGVWCEDEEIGWCSRLRWGRM